MSYGCNQFLFLLLCRCSDVGPQRLHLVLQESVLLPAGGGQPCDVGYLAPLGKKGLVDILAVTSTPDGTLLHEVDTPLAVGTEVTVSLDWARRFDHMQQHTGGLKCVNDTCNGWRLQVLCLALRTER